MNAETLMQRLTSPKPWAGDRDRFLEKVRRRRKLEKRNHRIAGGFPVAASLLACAFTAWLVFASPQKPEAPEVNPPRDGGLLRGQVLVKKGGTFIPGARVVVSIPAADMRNVRRKLNQNGLSLVETVAGPDGSFEVKVPFDGESVEASVDAFAPDYQSLAGTFAARRDRVRVTLKRGAPSEVTLNLERALYIAGTVVNEKAQPIPGVDITAMLKGPTSLAYIAAAETDQNGEFALYDYFEKRPRKSVGEVEFKHPLYERFVIADVYALTPAQNRNHRIVMRQGRRLSGRVVSSGGAPVPNALVEAEFGKENWQDRRAVLTDASGAFAIDGLSKDRNCTLRIRSLKIHEKARRMLLLDRNIEDLEVALEPMRLPPDLKTELFLGMKVAPVTKDLAEAYDLSEASGLLILDSGRDHARLNIGDLEEGDCLWVAGLDLEKVGSVRQLAALLVDQKGQPEGARVVYRFRRVEMSGTNTQHLRLTDADFDELHKLANR